MKHYLQTFIGCFLLVFAFQASAQNDCPAYPSQSKWEKTCYISVNQPDPTASDRQAGKLYLPEATFANKYGKAAHKSHIPDNRVHWALGIAHAWNYARNIQKNSTNPKISYWMATPLQESEWRCDGEAQWGDNIGSPVGTIVQQGLWEDGCFQIEGVNNGSAYGALISYYPQRFRSGEHSNLIGHDNFVTSTLVKTYYDLATERIATYRWGWDLSEAVEGTCDPYAFDKLSSSAFNAGIYAFQGSQSFMTGQNENCYWTGLPAVAAGYSTSIGDLMAVLENNMTYPITTFSVQGSSFDGYYNAPVKWSDVLLYLGDIDDLYWEVDFAKEVTPKAKAAFEQIAGDTLTSINFMDIGNVIDVVIMALPKEDPMQVAITSPNVPVGPNGTACSGNVVPVAQIEIEGETTICSGQTTTLIANTGGKLGYTFKWKKGEKVVSTGQEFIVTETAIGTYSYSLEICNEEGCNTADCDIVIEIEKCSTCDLTASATSTNSTCTTSEDGKIDIITENGKALYNVKYSSDEYDGEFELEAHNFSINNVPSGFYEIKLTDLLDASCVAYTSVEVEATTENNEILVIDSLETKDCITILKASLETLENPTCTYQVRVAKVVVGWPSPTDTTYMTDWEKWMIANISVNDQVVSSQANILGYQWGENSWDTADLVIYDYEVETDDIIEFSLALDGSPGSAQTSDYVFEIWNTETNQKVTSYFVPQGSAVIGTPYKVGTHTVSCEAPLPAHTYSWTPTVNNQVNTDVSSEVDVEVHYANDVEYVVTAVNTKNTQCVLTDTLTVKHNKQCSTCNDPGTIILDKTGTIKLCAGETTTLTTAITGIGDFVYDLYRGDNLITNNETGVFSLTEEGVYSVVVKDQGQPKDMSCVQYSDTISVVVDVCTGIENIQENNITAYPNPTTGRLVVSANDEIQNIVVLSLNGKVLLETTNQELDLSTYSIGMYLVKIITENTTQIIKVEKR